MNTQLPQGSYEELNQRVIDLLEGKGTEISRKLTKAMLKTFPSIVDLVSSEYQNRLQQVLAKDDF
jgi:hemoglobin-like flavoprotein